jgi:hypothetical protein
MPDRWTDDRERQWRERNWRSEAYGRGPDAGRDRGRSGEQRSFDEPGARFEGRDRDRVFGEEDTGAEYNTRNQPRPGGGGYGAGGAYGQGEGYGRDHQRDDDFRGRSDWRERDQGAPSGGLGPSEHGGQRGGRQPRFESQDYTRGGRFYGDDRRQPIYREEYGQGGRDYGPTPRGYDAGYQDRGRGFDRDRYRPEMQRPASGGTGGYDYERGYGDGGRGSDQSGEGAYGLTRGQGGQQGRSGRPAWQDPDYQGESPAMYRGGGYDVGRGRDHDQRRHEEPGRGGWQDREDDRGGAGGRPGEFLQRAGERLSSWFGGAMGEVRRDLGFDGPRRYSADFGREARWEVGGSHQGRGPKDYQRPDERISDEVHQRLTDDPWVDASQINCKVEKGEVTLTGFVENREAKHRAERCVEDIPGVSHVQNDLRVGGNFLNSAGRGYGDSVLESQMREDGTTGGGTAAGDDSAMSRSTTRRS